MVCNIQKQSKRESYSLYEASITCIQTFNLDCPRKKMQASLHYINAEILNKIRKSKDFQRMHHVTETHQNHKGWEHRWEYNCT